MSVVGELFIGKSIGKDADTSEICKGRKVNE